MLNIDAHSMATKIRCVYPEMRPTVVQLNKARKIMDRQWSVEVVDAKVSAPVGLHHRFLDNSDDWERTIESGRAAAGVVTVQVMTEDAKGWKKSR
jgi:hypothetical protein